MAGGGGGARCQAQPRPGNFRLRGSRSPGGWGGAAVPIAADAPLPTHALPLSLLRSLPLPSRPPPA